MAGMYHPARARGAARREIDAAFHRDPFGREAQREGAALAGFAADQQLGVVPHGDVLGDGQAQSGAADGARTAPIHAVEALGQPGMWRAGMPMPVSCTL